MNTLRDTYGPLLHLTEQDRRGLCWLKTRARQLLNGLKRRRRYGVPRGAHYTEQEGQLIEALAVLEREAGRLLDIIAGGQEKILSEGGGNEAAHLTTT